MVLRRALWAAGYRYRVNRADLAGKPDIVFSRARVVVFCDGDFWHGRSLDSRLARLKRGHNAEYWRRKIAANVQRDQRNTRLLQLEGWRVLRIWETDIHKDVNHAVDRIREVVGNPGRHRCGHV
jgi:DNA mismatch endonuclease (patch repair protein)